MAWRDWDAFADGLDRAPYLTLADISQSPEVVDESLRQVCLYDVAICTLFPRGHGLILYVERRKWEMA